MQEHALRQEKSWDLAHYKKARAIASRCTFQLLTHRGVIAETQNEALKFRYSLICGRGISKMDEQSELSIPLRASPFHGHRYP